MTQKTPVPCCRYLDLGDSERSKRCTLWTPPTMIHHFRGLSKHSCVCRIFNQVIRWLRSRLITHMRLMLLVENKSIRLAWCFALPLHTKKVQLPGICSPQACGWSHGPFFVEFSYFTSAHMGFLHKGTLHTKTCRTDRPPCPVSDMGMRTWSLGATDMAAHRFCLPLEEEQIVSNPENKFLWWTVETTACACSVSPLHQGVPVCHTAR